MKKLKSNGKKIFILVALIVLVIGAAIGYLVVDELQQEDILKQEIINFSNKDLVTGDFEVKVKTKGDYAYIEEAIKNYYKELSNNIKILNSYLTDENLIKILSAENISSDGPSFVNSYKLLEDTKANSVKAMEEIANLCKEDTIKNLLDKKMVDDYSYELYLDLMYSKEDLADMKIISDDMQALSNNLNTFLDKVIGILKFLEGNANMWSIEEGQLYFKSTALVNEYNNLYNDLTEFSKNNFSNIDNKYSRKSMTNSNI